MRNITAMDPEQQEIDIEKHPSSRDGSQDAGGKTEVEVRREAIIDHGVDADAAMQAFLGEDARDLVLDDATSKRLLRRIDMFLMPTMCLVYVCMQRALPL